MSQAEDFKQQMIATITATISSGQTISAGVNLFGTRLVGLVVPAGLTSTALTFLVSDDGITYYPLMQNVDGDVLTITVDATAKAYPLNPWIFAAWSFIKLVGGSIEAADRTFKLIPHSY
jgi:hypothetical protein